MSSEYWHGAIKSRYDHYMQNGTGELEKDAECLHGNFSLPLPKGGGNPRKKNGRTRGTAKEKQ